MSGDIRVELADSGEPDVAHGRVGKLGGEHGEVGRAGGVVEAGNVLGEHFSAEPGHVEDLMAGVIARDALAADDIERADEDGVSVAERVVAGILAERAGEHEGRKIGAVGLIEQAAPGVGIEAVDALAEGGVRVEPFGGDAGEAQEEER